MAADPPTDLDAVGRAWYQIPPAAAFPFQGELLWHYPLREVVEESDGGLVIEERTADVIVLSQGCDLENQKIERVLVAPTHRLEAWIQRNPVDLDRMDDIRQGLDTTLYLLPAWPGGPGAELAEDRVVDLADGWTERRTAIEQACAASHPRLALRSPALEHFSQAVARSFMRVGLEPGVPSFDLQKAPGGGEITYMPTAGLLARMGLSHGQPMRVLLRHRVRPATGEAFVVASSVQQPPIVGAGRSETSALASFEDRLAARWAALLAGEQRWAWLGKLYH
jgi:hypothetical protein